MEVERKSILIVMLISGEQVVQKALFISKLILRFRLEWPGFDASVLV